jgi:EmrB/QacA subfamily drug resistance transporter
MAPESGPVYQRRWWTLAVLVFSLLVISLDNTILNVALPTLVRDLGASASQLQWIVDGYVLVFAGLLLTAGSLGDRFGRKRALQLGLLAFAAGSVAAAFAGSAGQLIASRALMGVGGAFIMPSTLSVLTNVFPARERGRAIGIWAAAAGLGIAIGPVAGGWLLEHFWWGSVFLVNLPVVAIALVAGLFLVPESRDPRATPLDPAGAGLSIAGLTALVYAIIEAPSHGWTDPLILGAFAAAAVLLASFVAWELRTAHPMLDVRLFANRRFSAASGSIALVFFALFGSIFFITQYMQFVLGYDTLAAGVRVIPVALGIIPAAPLSARLAERFGTKVVVAGGLAVVAGSLLLLSTVSMTSGYALVGTSVFILGVGMGLAMAPATESIMGSLPLAKAGVGSAVNDTTRQVGGALGVAVLGSLLSSSYGPAATGAMPAGLPAQVTAAAGDSVGAAVQLAARIGGPLGDAVAEAGRTAFVGAMGSTLLVAAAVALAGSLLALVFLPARAAAPAPAEADEADTSPEAREPEPIGARSGG